MILMSENRRFSTVKNEIFHMLKENRSLRNQRFRAVESVLSTPRTFHVRGLQKFSEFLRGFPEPRNNSFAGHKNQSIRKSKIFDVWGT